MNPPRAFPRLAVRGRFVTMHQRLAARSGAGREAS